MTLSPQTTVNHIWMALKIHQMTWSSQWCHDEKKNGRNNGEHADEFRNYITMWYTPKKALEVTMECDEGKKTVGVH